MVEKEVNELCEIIQAVKLAFVLQRSPEKYLEVREVCLLLGFVELRLIPLSSRNCATRHCLNFKPR